MRTALHSVLREGREADYDKEHAEIWPEMARTLRDAGIAEWQIWRSGGNLFHVVEADDFDAAMEYLRTDPVNQRWQNHIHEIVDHFEPGVGDGHALPLVWKLSVQA